MIKVDLMTNLLYNATDTMNLGLGFEIGNRISLDITLIIFDRMI